jgi:hypothetical protein
MKNSNNSVAAAATPIALLGCGSRDVTVLEMIIHRFLADEFVIVAAGRAELAIIDGDSAGAAKAIAEWRMIHAEAPALILTLQPATDTAQATHFRKPIDVDGLIATLKKMRLALRQPPAPASAMPRPRFEVPAAALPAATPAPLKKAVVKPEAKPAEASVTKASAPEIKPSAPQAKHATLAAKTTSAEAKPKSPAPAAAVASAVVSPVPAPEPIAAYQVSLTSSDAHDLEGRDYCGSAEDVPDELLHTADCLRPDQAIQLYFDPDTRLLGLLRLAGKLAKTSQQVTHIRGLQRPLLIIPDTPMLVVSPIADHALRPLCNTSLFAETVGLGTPSPRQPDDFVYTFDELLWKVALWTSRGRLPRGSDPHQPVRLTGTPDFSRLTATPFAEAICQLWTQDQTLSPVATAARLRIAQRYVFALYSALRLLELVDLRRTPLVGEAEPRVYGDAAKKTTPVSRRDLLQGILTKLDNAA